MRMFESRKLAPLMQLVPIEAPTLGSALALGGQPSQFHAIAANVSVGAFASSSDPASYGETDFANQSSRFSLNRPT
jgi:hypothetical protein